MSVSRTSHLFFAAGVKFALCLPMFSSSAEMQHPLAQRAAASIPSWGLVYRECGSRSSLPFIQNACTRHLLCICINSWLPQPLYASQQGESELWLTHISPQCCSRSSVRWSRWRCYYFNSACLPAAAAFPSTPSERDSLLYRGNWVILFHLSLDKSFLLQ